MKASRRRASLDPAGGARRRRRRRLAGAATIEWVDMGCPMPSRGEAATRPHFAVKQIARRLGAKVVSPRNLDRLPPPGATLVLQPAHGTCSPSGGTALRPGSRPAATRRRRTAAARSCRAGFAGAARRARAAGARGADGRAEPATAAWPPSADGGRDPRCWTPAYHAPLGAVFDRAATARRRFFRFCGGTPTTSAAAQTAWSLDGPRGPRLAARSRWPGPRHRSLGVTFALPVPRRRPPCAGAGRRARPPAGRSDLVHRGRSGRRCCCGSGIARAGDAARPGRAGPRPVARRAALRSAVGRGRAACAARCRTGARPRRASSPRRGGAALHRAARRALDEAPRTASPASRC